MKVLFFLILILNCKKEIEFKKYNELLLYHPASLAKNYTKNSTWNNRVYNIDKIHLDYVLNLNKIDGFKEFPSKTKNIDLNKTKIDLIYKSFSPEVNSLIEEFVFAIYFCDNLGGSGLTGYIYDENKIIGGFIIFDSKVLDKKANEWITFKENSVFYSNSLSLEIKIEDEKNNTEENALRYIFLHELGHVISNVKNFSPDLRKENNEFTNYPFYRGVWKYDHKLTDENSKINIKKLIRFYSSENKISLEDNLFLIYPFLKETNFSTLYGSTSAQDHFAESFVSYIHVIKDKRPWKLIIKMNETKEIIYEMDNLISKNKFEIEFFRKNLLL